MDNLPVHKVVGVEVAIAAAGATLLYLPPYSPDLNPIEPAFSKMNAHLREAAERTIPRLLRRIGADRFCTAPCSRAFSQRRPPMHVSADGASWRRRFGASSDWRRQRTQVCTGASFRESRPA
jgi:DDE superfamily endonuclease